MNTRIARPLVVAALTSLVPVLAWGMGAKPKEADIEAANARILPLAKVKLAPLAPAGAAAGSRGGEELYKAVCGACHEAGVAGAPKIGDKAAWAPRIATGMEALLKSATNGKNAMPAFGGKLSAGDIADVAAYVESMSQKGWA